MTSALDQLLSQAAQDPADQDGSPAFRFENEGHTVSGVVTGLSSNDGGFGVYPILLIDSDEPIEIEGVEGHQVSVALHGLGTVLKDKLSEFEVGDEIAVRYEGSQSSKSGRSYRNYTVIRVPAAERA